MEQNHKRYDAIYVEMKVSISMYIHTLASNIIIYSFFKLSNLLDNLKMS